MEGLDLDFGSQRRPRHVSPTTGYPAKRSSVGSSCLSPVVKVEAPALGANSYPLDSHLGAELAVIGPKDLPERALFAATRTCSSASIPQPWVASASYSPCQACQGPGSARETRDPPRMRMTRSPGRFPMGSPRAASPRCCPDRAQRPSRRWNPDCYRYFAPSATVRLVRQGKMSCERPTQARCRSDVRWRCRGSPVQKNGLDPLGNGGKAGLNWRAREERACGSSPGLANRQDIKRKSACFEMKICIKLSYI